MDLTAIHMQGTVSLAVEQKKLEIGNFCERQARH